MLQLLAKKKNSSVKIYKIIPKINSHTCHTKISAKSSHTDLFHSISRQVGMFELHHAPFQEKHSFVAKRISTLCNISSRIQSFVAKRI